MEFSATMGEINKVCECDAGNSKKKNIFIKIAWNKVKLNRICVS